jgi:type IV pilus assembly protein PilX
MSDLSYRPLFKQQQGAVLVIGLIMLLLLTVIGMSSIRGTDLQERMAGNARDHHLAFQATEAAVRSAENYLSGASISAYSNGAGYHKDLTGPTSPLFWSPEDWGTGEVAGTKEVVKIADNTLKGISEQPKYVIEQLEVSISPGNLGSAVDQQSLDSMAEREVYRITARGLGGTKDSEALIQTTFIR